MNHLIEDQQQLKSIEPLLMELCEAGGIVSVDTEFLREKTYNAKLCLMQIGIGSDQYCIDVLQIEDLSVLKTLMACDAVTKLFHAARQDMEVIVQTLGVLPKPIFDTQLAAAFCGADMQVGYGALVSDVTGIELPKSQSRTDWTKRPLSADQIKYAGEDVAYLEALYERGLGELREQNKEDWFNSEIELLYDKSLYLIDPSLAYKRLNGGMLKLKHQYRLKALAKWREQMAQSRDIPRTWIMRDDKLFELAQSSARTVDQVIEMAIFGKKSASRLAPQVLAILKEVKAGDQKIWRRVEPLTKAEKSVCSQLMQTLSSLSASANVAQALLGTRKDIESLFRNRQSKKLLRGWRKELVGEPLLEAIRKLEGQAL